MSSQTLDGIRNGIRTIMDLDTTEMPNTTVDLFIKEAWKRIENAERRWPFFDAEWSLDTAVGDYKYTLTDIKGVTANTPLKIKAIYGTDRMLCWLPHDEARRRYMPNIASNTGTPQYWSAFNSTIYLWPTPTAIETLVYVGYRKGNDWFTAGADVPDCPDSLHNAIFMWSLAQAYAQQEDYESASYYNGKAVQEVQAATEQIMQTPDDDTGLVIGGTSRYSGRIPNRLRYPFDGE